MKKIDNKQKEWNDRRSKKLAVKKKQNHSGNGVYSSINKKTTFKNKKNRENIYSAPNNFSVINNTNATIKYFNNLFSFISKKSHVQRQVFISLMDTETLTIDAVMFLIAIINNLQIKYRMLLSFKGSSPKDKAAKKIFEESGFYNYVKRIGKEEFDKNDDNIQIVSGVRCDTVLAKRISDFVHNKYNVSIKELSFLYIMMIELMSNTNKHAYSEKETLMNSKWYCYVKCIDDKTVAFSFLDTGLGIPSTIKKKFFESIVNPDDDRLLVSVLNGEFRSRTMEGYRGKGIPKIREYSKKNIIKNLQIITNYAKVKVNKDFCDGSLVKEKFMGTLYYWEITF